MVGWKNESWLGRLKFIAFALIPVVTILVVGQTCAWVSINRTVGIWTDSLTGQKYYSMRIGHWPWSHQNLTPLNSLDLPDAEFVGLLPKGSCTHVLFAGDSFTFGDATDHDKRWTALIEGMTARRLPERCIRFFNIGVRNSTIDTTIVRIRQVMPLIEPDVVVLGQYQNDLTDLSNPGSPAWVPARRGRPDSHWGTRLGRLVPGYNVSLLRLITYQAFAFMIKRDIRYDVLGTWSVLVGESKRDYAEKLKGIYRQLYASLVTELRSDGIDFAALVFPSKMDVLAQRYPEGAFFTELAEEFEVPYLSLMPTLDEHRDGMPYYLYDGHLNEYGNKLVAGTVWDWLFETRPHPVPALADAGEGGAGSTSGVPER